MADFSIDINGVVILSGTGSVNGLINFQYASNSGGSISGEVLHGSLTLGDSWTQNYASNTLNLSTGSLVYLSSWSTGGTPTNITDTTGAYVNYFANAQLGIAFPDVMPIGTTFNTAGSESYGQIGSPTVSSVVNVTPVPNYGTVVPSDPDKDYTQPAWVTDTVWTCRGVAALSFIGVGVAGAASLGLFGGTVDVAIQAAPAPYYVHFLYGVNGVWEQALLGTGASGLGGMTILGGQPAASAWVLSGIPVLFPDAVLAGEDAGYAYSCFTAAISAIARGWGL